jgi:hypothetical protein
LLDSLITSKTRVKLILKFFLNPETRAYLRGLSEEFGESTNGIRVELNRLADAGLLKTSENGRTILYGANKDHPLFPELHSLVKKYLGIDQLIDNILAQLGSIELAFVTGDYARGIDSGIIDIVIVGSIDHNYLQSLIQKVEKIINRKFRSLVLTNAEFVRLRDTLHIEDALPVWGCSTMR